MTTSDVAGDGLAAALIQISAHAESIASLDAREAAHFDDIATRLRFLADEIAAISANTGPGLDPHPFQEGRRPMANPADPPAGPFRAELDGQINRGRRQHGHRPRVRR